MEELGEDPSINQRAREADDLAQTTSTFDEISIRDSADAQVEDGNDVGVGEKKTSTPPTLPARRAVPAVPSAAVEVGGDEKSEVSKEAVEVEDHRTAAEEGNSTSERVVVEESEKGKEEATSELK